MDDYITWLSSPECMLAHQQAADAVAGGGTDEQADVILARARGDYLDRAEAKITALETSNRKLLSKNTALAVENDALRDGAR